MNSLLKDIVFAIGFTCLEIGVAQQFGGPVAWMVAGVILIAVSVIAALKSTRPKSRVS
ncbi:MAG: hypothetical protein HGB01_06905 [Chlorobiaceae bacterium]|nr:hypothetical protein [Chlorobiaceae bacterium]